MLGRDQIVEWLERKLVGPGLGIPDEEGGWEHETIEGRMTLAYMQGMLYPRASEEPDDTGGDDDGDDEGEDGFETPDDPLAMATALMPASMGITFCIREGASVDITVHGARYKPGERQSSSKDTDEVHGETWKRVPLSPTTIRIEAGAEVPERTACLEGMASVSILPRRLQSGDWLLTVSLSNENDVSRPDPEKTIFQARISAVSVEERFEPYPEGNYLPLGEEERELRVIYRDQAAFAVGHGIAADWELESDGTCRHVTTSALPKAHVWRPRFDELVIREGGDHFNDDGLFNVAMLASDALEPRELFERLERFISFYEKWIEAQKELEVPAGLEKDAERIIKRCIKSAARMREGAQLLAQGGSTFKAFRLANRAMLMSMSHFARASGRSREDGRQGPFELGEAETGPIDYFANTRPAWRPFQLAFILQTLPSLVDENHEDRESVDVIWFPTGGGKTEAYLLAAAFELVRRRLVHGEVGAGTGVINRYTYRFLTSDQFQRTSGMVCALEMLRRVLRDAGDNSLGEAEFSIGLFVGGEVSPNKVNSPAYDGKWKSGGALQWCSWLYEAEHPRASNPFPIESCPCCGTLLVPSEKKQLPSGDADLSFYGFVASASSFRIRCPEEDCDFHDGLPTYVVDDQFIRNPTSFLLGTIDKFAMITGKKKGSRFLGENTNTRPPSLIIPDELRIISGPLGTLAGIYEAAFETVVRSTGSPTPKVIAATATIRNASVQCRRTYGRKGIVFPSPGIRAEDTFFARMDVGNTKHSRLYVGLMGQGLRSTVAVSWAIAAILQSVSELEGQLTVDELDAYWSLVAYHNSKRELGRIVNATRDEIPARLKVYAEAEDVERNTDFDVLELKAHAEVPIPVARQKLGQRHDPPASPAVDIVPCTSIISVGVDIDRLGLMLVNGQPKLTAEYIQASSRVGRGKVPGLVMTCFSPSKPRDRSHYEAFRNFHERFYSFVEPTSVTPGSLPAIKRALHAALVTAVRHGTGLKDNQGARRFDPAEVKSKQVLATLLKRLQAAYPETADHDIRLRLASELDRLTEQWENWRKSNSGLTYVVAPSQQDPALLRRFEDKLVDGVGWHTLQSMRHVDSELALKV